MTLVIPATLSVLVSIWMETLFYGINIVVYLICLYVFLSRRTKNDSKAQLTLIITCTLLFVSATAHIAVNVRRLIEGYVLPKTKADMTRYLVDITQSTNIAKEYLLVAVNLFSDIIITWRVYIVWGRNWRITLIPLVLCTSVFIVGMIGATTFVLAKPGQSIFRKQTESFGTPLMCLNLVMNVTATILIASRIWWVTREPAPNSGFPSGPSSASLPTSVRRRVKAGVASIGSQSRWRGRNNYYWRLVVLVIESASLAALAQLLELSFYAAKFPGIYFVGDTSVQIVAMSPLLIIALLGLTRRNSGTDWANSTSYDVRTEKGRERTPGRTTGKETETEISEIRFQSRGSSYESDGFGTHGSAGLELRNERETGLPAADELESGKGGDMESRP